MTTWPETTSQNAPLSDAEPPSSRVIVARPMMPDLYRIRRVTQETADIFTFELDPVGGESHFDFLPGQFNMIYMFGTGEVAISISGDPTAHGALVHTIRAVGPATRAICKLKKGGILGIRGPFGSAWPVEEAKGQDVLFVTGGIGLAPLRPAIYYVLAHREQYGRLVVLYGARSPQRLLFKKELEQWRGRFDIDLEVAVGSATDAWRGNVGVITSLVAQARIDPAHTLAMLCSSETMMRALVQELGKRNVAKDQIYISMERSMKCGIGLCGHCQLGPHFMCKDGPVYRYDRIETLFNVREA